jgi:ribosomal protein L18
LWPIGVAKEKTKGEREGGKREKRKRKKSYDTTKHPLLLVFKKNKSMFIGAILLTTLTTFSTP